MSESEPRPRDPAVPFSAVTALSEQSPGVFGAEVHPSWTIAGKPNGGYLLAMLGRAAVAVGPHEHVWAASAHYLHSPEPGPVTIVAEVLRAGRSASQMRARMTQRGDGGEQPCVEALITTGRLDRAARPTWDAGAPRPGTARFEDGIRLSDAHPSGLAVPIMDQVDLRMDRDTAGYLRGRPSGNGELRGWLALPGRGFDPVSLLYAVDAFPPATLEIELTGWVPTLELTAYVRALPAPGPVQVIQRAHVIDDRKVDEACWVFDSTGRVVAQATQLAGIRIGR